MLSIFNSIYKFLNKYRRYVPMCIDAFVAVVSYLISSVLMGQRPGGLKLFSASLLIYLFIFMGTFITTKTYKAIWRYTSVDDLGRCSGAAFLANVIFYMVILIINVNIKFDIILMATALSIIGVMGARIMYRMMLQLYYLGCKTQSDKKVNVMLIGAGQATETMLSEIKFYNPNNYNVRCIVDDDSTKIGRYIKSVQVVANTYKIKETVKKYNIEQIVLSIPSIDRDNKKRILETCADTQCKLKILPQIYSLLSDEGIKNLVGKLRDVEVEDLLGRDPIVLDCQMTKESIQHKTVLVTGGGGSIGSELCRQVASYSPQKLIILDIYENNAYNIQQELIRLYGDRLNLEVEIASVRDIKKLEAIFAKHDIDIVFHAAAHKHVPLMEKNPEEAIKNNIIGTYNTVSMADKYRVGKFVLISTDKAVNPTNVMGATKRVCEMIIQAFDKKSRTDYVAVRFGNVLGSNGSVVPLFIDQIKHGGPVTVTDEEITRYFMTIPEAVQLVLRAASIAKGGEIFVLDMGEPVKIKDLAYNIIRLSGLIPNKDIKIKYTGLRPGEKLYEELLIAKDSSQIKTDIDKIFIERPTEINSDTLFKNILKLEKAASDMDTEIQLLIIEKLVPTYRRTPNGSNKLHKPTEDKVRKWGDNEETEIVFNVLHTESVS